MSQITYSGGLSSPASGLRSALVLYGSHGIGDRAVQYISPSSTAGTFVNEPEIRWPIPTNGTLSNFYVYIPFPNTLVNPTVLTVRVNGVDTAITITIPGGANGLFTDLTHSAAVAAGDLVTARVDGVLEGSGSLSADISLGLTTSAGLTGPYVSTLTGNAGGAVGPSAGGNINFTGTDPIVITGNPGANALVATIQTATTAQIGATTLATNAETIAGAVTTKAVTPDDLKVKLGTQTNHGLPIGAGTASAFTWTAAPTNGQILMGSTGADPVLGTITAGTGVSVTNGAGTITIGVTGGGITWSREAGAAVAMAAGHGYININVGLTTFTLPALAAVGDTFMIAGESAGLWTIAQNAGQNIQFGAVSTTPGVAGSLTATNRYDALTLVCRVANTTWAVLSSVGVLIAA